MYQHLFSHESPQYRCGRPVWLSHGCFPTRQAKGSEMRKPAELQVARNQKLSAPNPPVSSIPRPVPGDSQHITVKPVFRHTESHMGMVMLHGNQRN